MSRIVRKAAYVGLAAGVYLGITGGNLNPADAKHDRRTEEELAHIAAERKAERYEHADALGKYSLLYLQNPVRQDQVAVGTMENGGGLIGKVHGWVWGRTVLSEIGQTCFYGSMYDPVHEITEYHATGLEATPHLYAQDGVVIVEPAVSAERPLQFAVDESGLLQPANDHTKEKLTQYGCETPATL